MMNIAIDARSIIHWDKTGVWVYTEKLIEFLSEIDLKNQYYLLFSGLRLKSQDIRISINGNFKKVILPVPDRNFACKDFIWNHIALPYFFRKDRIDLFHSPANHTLPISKNVKKIITIHDLRSLHIQEDILSQNIEKIRKSCNTADAVIAVSEFTRQDIITHLGICREKVKTIYPGIDGCFKKIDNESVAAQFKEKYKLTKPFFFSLGLLPRKNTKRLLLAYAKFKYKDDFMLVIAGSGARDCWFEEYKGIIREKELKNSILLLSSISQQDLVLFYNCAFALTFVSLFEGFGLPVLEAMACGTPVITSKVSALPEVGGDAAFYVDPYNTDDITEAMETLVENNLLRQNLIKKGLNRVKEFSWEKTARETLEIYKQIVN